VVGWEHRQLERVRQPGDTRTVIVLDVVVLLVLHQRELLEVRLHTGVVRERDRKVLGESPLEEDGLRPVTQQAAKRLRRRLDRLCTLQKEQKRIGVHKAVERVQRHFVAHDLVAKRHHLVHTTLGALVPKLRVPTDLGHAVARVVRQPGLRHHVNEVGQRLVMRVDTTRVRTSAVAHAHVIQTVVGDPRDPINNLHRFRVCVVRAERPKLAQDLRVREAIHFRMAPRGGMRPVDARPAIGNADVHRHRCQVRHSVGRYGVFTLAVAAGLAALAADAALAALAAVAAGLAALAADEALVALAAVAAGLAVLAADAALAALAAVAAGLAALAADAALAALAAVTAGLAVLATDAAFAALVAVAAGLAALAADAALAALAAVAAQLPALAADAALAALAAVAAGLAALAADAALAALVAVAAGLAALAADAALAALAAVAAVRAAPTPTSANPRSPGPEPRGLPPRGGAPLLNLAIRPRPVREHEDKGWPRADTTRTRTPAFASSPR